MRKVDSKNKAFNSHNRNPKGKGGFTDHPEHMNLKGRPPKGYSFAERLREFLDMTGHEVDLEEKLAGENLDGLDRMDLVVRAVVRSAMSGSTGAQRLIRDTIDGLPTQNVHFLGGGKKPLRIIFDRGAIDNKEKLENEEISHGKKDDDKPSDEHSTTRT